MKIAVAGAGIAGTTVAWLLREGGHEVTLFEQAKTCGPVGAGFLLQPSGQLVLQQLGLLDEVIRQSTRIDWLHAQHQNGGTLVHLAFKRISSRLHARGVRRHVTFDLLSSKCKAAGVTMQGDCRIVDGLPDGDGVSVVAENGKRCGRFDLLVAADGSSSAIRSARGENVRVREYEDAALWCLGPWSGDATGLQQFVARNGRLVGILPIGNEKCSFFWGLRKSDEPIVRARGIDPWKRELAQFYPPAAEIVDPLSSMDELVFASYRNVWMPRVTRGRIVWIGDAAHATSPHLGQGVNLALQDALALANCLNTEDEIQTALRAYEVARKSTTRFYARLTGAVTPFFQTDNRLLQFGRDLALPVTSNLPWLGRQMVLTMAGLKNAWLSDQQAAAETALRNANLYS